MVLLQVLAMAWTPWAGTWKHKHTEQENGRAVQTHVYACGCVHACAHGVCENPTIIHVLCMHVYIHVCTYMCENVCMVLCIQNHMESLWNFN